MKKLFNYALLAAALLIGVNVNAENVCTLRIGEGQPTTHESVKAALDAIAAYQTTDVATIDMIDDALETSDLFFENERTYVWNFNGKTVTIGSGATCGLHIDHANVTLNGEGTLQASTGMGRHYLVLVHGSTNPNDANYTTVTVDKKLNITTAEKQAYAFDIIYRDTRNGDKVTGGETAAYGVTVNFEDCYVYGYYGAITIVGNLTGDGENRPVVNISKDAELVAYDQPCALDDKSKAAVAEHFSLKWYGDKNHQNEPEVIAQKESYKESSSAIYGAGVATWNIHGNVHGGNGLYIKGGKVVLNGATVAATAPEYHEPIVSSNGYMACGSAIVLDSNNDYGELDGVTITNSTITSDSGYGIEEVATQGNSKVPDIVIESGTITGELGSLTTTAEVKENVVLNGTITGGTFSNDVIDNYIDHISAVVTPVDNADGTTSYVVTPIQGGKDAAEARDLATTTKDDDVMLKEDKTLTDDAECKNLVVENAATLTIGKKLTVYGTLTIQGKVIVKADATLIIEGNGVTCLDATKFVIEAREGQMGQFLLSPSVLGNKHPLAIVRFYSKSFYHPTNGNQVQIFGNPMTEMVNIKAYQQKDDVEATDKIYFDVWRNNAWDYIGSINDVEPMNYPKFNIPFGTYALTTKNEEGNKLYFDMSGKLMGNDQPSNFRFVYGWTNASNSWTGNADAAAVLAKLKAAKDAGLTDLVTAIYTYTQVGNVLSWNAHTASVDVLSKIEPMQPILFDNEGASAETDILSYENLVWNFRNSAANHAPKFVEMTQVGLRITAANGVSDRVILAESNDEDVVSAPKYMNEYVCVYANVNKAYDIYAADNIANTFVGFNCKNAGKYTISFENVSGNFDLVDTKTNARIAMAEGTTYEFLAEAGEDAYRFMIVEAAKAPTNTPATKAAVKATRALINGQIVISNGERFFNVLGTDVK